MIVHSTPNDACIKVFVNPCGVCAALDSPAALPIARSFYILRFLAIFDRQQKVSIRPHWASPRLQDRRERWIKPHLEHTITGDWFEATRHGNLPQR
jgi:hypothetical protein